MDEEILVNLGTKCLKMWRCEAFVSNNIMWKSTGFLRHVVGESEGRCAITSHTFVTLKVVSSGRILVVDTSHVEKSVRATLAV